MLDLSRIKLIADTKIINQPLPVYVAVVEWLQILA